MPNMHIMQIVVILINTYQYGVLHTGRHPRDAGITAWSSRKGRLCALQLLLGLPLFQVVVPVDATGTMEVIRRAKKASGAVCGKTNDSSES